MSQHEVRRVTKHAVYSPRQGPAFGTRCKISSLNILEVGKSAGIKCFPDLVDPPTDSSLTLFQMLKFFLSILIN